MAAHIRSVRAGHKGVVTKKLTELEEALRATPLDKDLLEKLRTTLQEKLDLLKKLSNDIVELLVNEAEIIAEIESSETLIDSIRSALIKLNRILGTASTPPPPVETPTIASRMKLPKLALPSFDGNYTRWLTFWDSYESAVHKNPELSDIDKFTYLKSLLQPEMQWQGYR